MQERWGAKFGLAAWLLMPGLCCAQGLVNPFAGNAEAAADGRKLFLQSCATCHGATGEGAEGQVEGMRPPDLTRGEFKAGRRDEDLFRVISEGVQGTLMPSFKSLGTDQIWRLVVFVRSLSAVTPALNGDPAAGETLFWGKGGCGRCHQIGSRGGRLGPDLSRGGRGGRGGNASARLKESIVDPNADIAPGYAIITVVTGDGRTITGVERWLDNFSVRLIDESGNEHSFLRDEVKSVTREMRSLMPGNYGQILTEAEINNLVAYITATRSKANSQ
jgi:putative heme-binding domain-containing protein